MPTNCNITLNGATDKCIQVYGGIVEVAIIPKDDISGGTILDGEVTTMSVDVAPAIYEFRERQAQLTKSSAIDFDSSTTVYNNTLVFSLKGMSIAQRNEIMTLTKAQNEFVVFAKADTGLIYVIGFTDGMDGDLIGARITQIEGDSGMQRSDTSQFTINIGIENDKELPYVIDKTTYDSLFL